MFDNKRSELFSAIWIVLHGEEILELSLTLVPSDHGYNSASSNPSSLGARVIEE